MNLVLAGATQCRRAAVLRVGFCLRGWLRHGQMPGEAVPAIWGPAGNPCEPRPEPGVCCCLQLSLWGVSVLEMWLKEAG